MRAFIIYVCGFIALYACSNDEEPSPGSNASASGTSAAGGYLTVPSGIGASGGSALGAGGSAPTVSNAGNSGSVSNNAGTGDTTTPNNAGISGASGSGTSTVGTNGSDTSSENAGTSGTTAPNNAESEVAGAGGSGGAIATKPQLAVSADFVNQSLSIVDLERLVPGATRDDALVDTIELGGYLPGPLDLAITPDGKIALVSISAGWLRAFDATIPPGNGTVLIVDLEKREVVKDLKTGASPMGIVITKDGKRAFVGLYGSALHVENYILAVDIENQTFERIMTGGSYNEELAIDDTGTVAILTYSTTGNVKTFNVDNPTAQGATFGLTGDAAGVAFFPGSKLAFLVQAPTPLTATLGGHNIIDVSNPLAPVASDNVRFASPKWYPVTAVPHRESVAVPTYENGELTLVEWMLEGNTAVEAQTIRVGDAKNIAYGASVDKKGRVLLALPADNAVSIVDLDTQQSFTVDWDVTSAGPTSIRVIP